MMNKYQMILYQYVTTGVGVLVILFNSLMIIYIKYMRTFNSNPVGYVYITNMAVTDLLVGIIMVLLKSMHPYMDNDLADKPFAQDLYHFIRFFFLRFSLLTSVFNLIALAVDRFSAIRFPFLVARQNPIFHVRVCCGVWMVSLLLTSAFYAIIRFYLQNPERYKDAIFPIATFPAMVLFFVCYGYIFSVVSHSSNTVQQLTVSSKNDPNDRKNQQSQKEKVTTYYFAN